MELPDKPRRCTLHRNGRGALTVEWARQVVLRDYTAEWPWQTYPPALSFWGLREQLRHAPLALDLLTRAGRPPAL